MKIYVCDVESECVHTGQAEKFAWPYAVGIEPATFGLLVQCSTDWARELIRTNSNRLDFVAPLVEH